MPLRCLIVDDSPSFLAAASRMLEREGLSVAGVASSGADAVLQAAALDPDVVLVDVFLGAESGIDVARRLGAQPRQRPLSVILISTHSHAGLADLLAASDVDAAYVCKQNLSAAAVSSLVEARAGVPCQRASR
jgi:CheY-like chemotaxis protein